MIKAFIGIDPGKFGAAALITQDESLVFDWPGCPMLAASLLKDWHLSYNIVLAAVEKVHAMPGQGVTSMFSFGQNLGQWQGILAAFGIPFLMPAPQTWQKGLVDKKAGQDTKEASLITARRLFPDAVLHLKKHHGRSDALLLAWWAMQQKVN